MIALSTIVAVIVSARWTYDNTAVMRLSLLGQALARPIPMTFERAVVVTSTSIEPTKLDVIATSRG